MPHPFNGGRGYFNLTMIIGVYAIAFGKQKSIALNAIKEPSGMVLFNN